MLASMVRDGGEPTCGDAGLDPPLAVAWTVVVGAGAGTSYTGAVASGALVATADTASVGLFAGTISGLVQQICSRTDSIEGTLPGVATTSC